MQHQERMSMRDDVVGRCVPTIVGITTFVLAACTSSGATSGLDSTPPTGSLTASSGATSSHNDSIDLSSLRGRIAFSAGAPLHEDIYIMKASGNALVQVTRDPAADFDPTWSPEGTQIAYRHQAGPHTTQTDIFVTAVGGGEPTDLTMSLGVSDWGPAWSPVGAWIAWNSMRDDPRSGVLHGFLMHPDGSGVRRITDEIWVEYPAWSPDGRKIAFMAQEPGASGLDPDYNIYVMNADGSGITQAHEWPRHRGIPRLVARRNPDRLLLHSRGLFQYRRSRLPINRRHRSVLRAVRHECRRVGADATHRHLCPAHGLVAEWAIHRFQWAGRT